MTIYFLETQYRYWIWHDMISELIVYLKDKYNAKIVHQKGGFLDIPFGDYKMSDCEILIHDEEKDILFGVCWSEILTGLFDIFKNRNNKNDIFIVSQFHNLFPKDFDKNSVGFNLKQGTFYPLFPTLNYDYYYNQRMLNKALGRIELKDQMFCLTTTGRASVYKLRDIDICCPAAPPLNIDQYLELAIQYKMGYACAGNAEVCHRDFEYLAIGLPMIRMEYMTQLDPPLIPNYHYISVSREGFNWDMYQDREGGENYTEAFKKRFFEVKDDLDFLSFITKNGRDYYINYCSTNNRVKHIIEKLNI
jgi:hypothetical protein